MGDKDSIREERTGDKSSRREERIGDKLMEGMEKR